MLVLHSGVVAGVKASCLSKGLSPEQSAEVIEDVRLAIINVKNSEEELVSDVEHLNLGSTTTAPTA